MINEDENALRESSTVGYERGESKKCLFFLEDGIKWNETEGFKGLNFFFLEKCGVGKVTLKFLSINQFIEEKEKNLA